MSEILNRIDAVVGGLCPCGAEPAAGSAWCSEDCRPVPGAGRDYMGETWTELARNIERFITRGSRRWLPLDDPARLEPDHDLFERILRAPID